MHNPKFSFVRTRLGNPGFFLFSQGVCYFLNLHFSGSRGLRDVDEQRPGAGLETATPSSHQSHQFKRDIVQTL